MSTKQGKGSKKDQKSNVLPSKGNMKLCKFENIGSLSYKVQKSEEIPKTEELKNPKIELTLDVDPQHYSRIIGRGGIVVNKIRKDHNVFIKVPERSSDERSIIVTGYEKDAKAAKEIIMKLLKEQDQKSPKIQLKMEVDPQHYPFLIGRGGVVINKIRKDHNVFIKFPECNSNERMITITGYEKDAESAKEAIMELFVKKRRGSLAGLITKYQMELKHEVVLKSIESTDPVLYREIHNILDKLTISNVGILIEKIKNLDIDTEEKLNVVVNLVYERFIHDSNSTTLYADLCKRLALVKVPSTGQPGKHVNLRKLLIIKCQNEFEQGICYELEYEDLLKTVELTDDVKSKGLIWRFNKEKETLRYRRIGNIRFISELFKLNMLIVPAVREYIHRLLDLENEISVECACILIKNVATKLEGSGHSSYGSFVNKYSQQLQNILDRNVRNSRIRFMLEHIINLRGPVSALE